MPRSESLGQFEQLVLTAVLSLKTNAYGVTIQKKAAELCAPKTVTLAAVYVTLDRLEEKAYVSSWLSAPTAERGGRAKRCYKLEAKGELMLKDSIATAMRMAESAAAVWGRGQKGWAKA